MLLVGGGNYALLTLNSFCFGSYAEDVFLGLALRVRVRTCCALARNSALLAILISTRLISAILYSRYNSRRAAAIEDHAGRTFYIHLGPNGPNYTMVGVDQRLDQRAALDTRIAVARASISIEYCLLILNIEY